MWQGDEIDAEAQPPEELLAADNNLRKRLCKYSCPRGSGGQEGPGLIQLWAAQRGGDEGPL